MDAHGIPELITELYRQVTSNDGETSERSSGSQQQQNHPKLLKALRKQAYTTLLGHLIGPLQCHNNNISSSSLGIVDELYSYIYYLRQRRYFDNANRLEKIVDLLVKDGISDETLDVLRLLSLLANSNLTINQDYNNLPIVYKDKYDSAVFPTGALYYGDTRVPMYEQRSYMHYSRSLFQQPIVIPTSHIDKQETFNDQVFNQKPGLGLQRSQFFATPFMSNGSSATCGGSLFGGLVHSKAGSLDVKLELPQLTNPEDTNWVINNTISSLNSKVTSDEGFTELSSEATETGESAAHSVDSGTECCEEFWEEVLAGSSCKRFVWESVGRHCPPVEKPFITEASPVAFDHLSQHWHGILQLIADTSSTFREISQTELIRDVLNLLMGLSSNTFLYDSESRSFHMVPGTFVSGMSTQTLVDACTDFLQCGSDFLHLSWLCMHTYSWDTSQHPGLIMNAFIDALSYYFHHYVHCLIKIPVSSTLMRVKFVMQKLMRQVRCLAELCMINDDVEFPKGIALLSYLYKETLESRASVHYNLMLSLLKAAAVPYLRYVQQWVFDGSCSDMFGEFLIQPNNDFLSYRDQHYWTSGFTLHSLMDSKFTLFLTELSQEVFSCGKTLNLLRLCTSNHHFLFGTVGYNGIEHPHVAITTSTSELEFLTLTCDLYNGHMTEMARQQTLSHKEAKRKLQRARLQVRIEARHSATRKLRLIEARMLQERIDVDNKKRQQFDELKEQMETDLERRAAEKASDKEMDAKLNENYHRQELLEVNIEQEQHEKARDELIAHYRDLMAAATIRERKALWKVQRHRLETRRLNFLEDEQATLTELLEKKPLGVGIPEEDEDEVDTFTNGPEDYSMDIEVLPPTVPAVYNPDRSPDDLPAWARVNVIGTGTEKTVHVQDPDPDLDLPQWARKGLQSYMAPFGLDFPTAHNLPSWAQRGLNSDEVISVNNFAEQAADIAEILAVQQSPAQKPILKRTTGHNVWEQTVEHGVNLASVKPVAGHHIADETDSIDVVPEGVKNIQGSHVSMETKVDEVVAKKSGIKLSATQNATKQTEPELKVYKSRPVPSQLQESLSPQIAPPKNRIRVFANKHASMTTEPDTQPHTSTGRRGVLGQHVSDISNSPDPFHRIPRLKRQKENVAPTKEDLRCFQIIPHRRRVQGCDIQKQTMNVLNNENDEREKNKLQRFRETNIHGHATDSSIQKLMYGNDVKEVIDTSPVESAVSDIELWTDCKVEPYVKSYPDLAATPMIDILTRTVHNGYTPQQVNNDVEESTLLPLPKLIQHSIAKPLLTQVRLVNQSVLDYFLVEFELTAELSCLRHWLLMEDGEFAYSLSDQLFERLSANPNPNELINPLVLNSVIGRAFRYSTHRESKQMQNVSFVVRYMPKILHSNSIASLNCLTLMYKMSWPLNIVVTDTCLAKYGRVFSFMLKLKQAVWALRDIGRRLKRDAKHVRGIVGPDDEMRDLQLFRHEMHHFVESFQSYIAHQIIHVLWHQLQDNLENDCRDLDDLIRKHQRYINGCIIRCFLNKKSEKIMRIIENLLSCVLKFRTQLLLHCWQTDDVTNEPTHPAFHKMTGIYCDFQAHSSFLYKLLRKRTEVDHKSHFEELLLRLNYNSFYSETG